MDTDTKQTIEEGEHGKALLMNEHWLWAKQKLTEIMEFYLSLASLPDYKTATALQSEISARKKAAGFVRSWIEEVEGSGTQHQFNNQLTKHEDGYITHFKE